MRTVRCQKSTLAIVATCGLLGPGCYNPGFASEPMSIAGPQAGAGAPFQDVNVTLSDAASADAESYSAIATSPRTTCAAAAGTQRGSCTGKIAGIYALEIALDAWWADEADITASNYDPGRGTISVFVKAELTEPCANNDYNDEAEVNLRICGLRLPPLYADANGGVLQLQLPDSVWDRPEIGVFNSKLHATGLAAMDTLSFSATAATFGIELNDITAAWPTFQDTPFLRCSHDEGGGGCFPDQDGDGQPGISARVQLMGEPPEPRYPHRGAWHYVPMSTDPSSVYADVGAERLYLGMRVRLAGSHPLGDDCAEGVGAGDADEIAFRVLDCAMRDGTQCSAAGATFVDQHVPHFHVLAPGETPPASWRHRRKDADASLDRRASAGPAHTLLRLGNLEDTLACADVRAAFEADVEL